MTQPVYKINHLTKIYKTGNVLANDDISLEIKQGEIFGIFGPNGAGKTTLVRQMAGLIKPSSGSIHLNDIDVIQNPEAISHYTAYFAQAPWILWSLKVWETIFFTGIFRGLSKKHAKKPWSLYSLLGVSVIITLVLLGIMWGGYWVLETIGIAPYLSYRPLEIVVDTHSLIILTVSLILLPFFGVFLSLCVITRWFKK